MRYNATKVSELRAQIRVSCSKEPLSTCFPLPACGGCWVIANDDESGHIWSPSTFTFFPSLPFLPVSPGVCLSVDVQQTPLDVLRQPGGDVQLVCSHEKNDYRLMYWFQRLPSGRELSRIGHVYYGTVDREESFKQHFNMTGDMSGDGPKNGSLLITSLKSDHSAVYYCAASYHTDCMSARPRSKTDACQIIGSLPPTHVFNLNKHLPLLCCQIYHLTQWLSLSHSYPYA